MMSSIGSIITPARLPQAGIVRLGWREAGRIMESGHFLFDTDDETRARIEKVYGPSPAAIDITFHTNDFHTVFKCEYQRWGLSKSKKPYMMCSGNGTAAREYEQKQDRPCPCTYLGMECRMKVILRFLIPQVTMGGAWILVSKSEHSASIIQTTLQVALRSGGLIMRPFKLLRTAGYARINGSKVKKFYLSLMLDEAAEHTTSETPAIESTEVISQAAVRGMIPIFLPPPLSESDEKVLTDRVVEERLKTGRDKVKRKLKLVIRDPLAAEALEAYACSRFGRETFTALTIAELLILWKDLGTNKEVVGAIYDHIPAISDNPR